MTPQQPVVALQDYTFELPESRIARYPVASRDKSKLLVYNKESISHHSFDQLPDILPVNSTLFLNNTKVIPARLLFEKVSGAGIEVFLLTPVHPSPLLIQALSATQRVTWKCAIGNLKKWDEGTPLRKHMGPVEIMARLIDRSEGLVELSWTPQDLPFAMVIKEAGVVPLPPYIKRDSERADIDRYQTVYSQFEGAVAAPTAGLHFTSEVLSQLQRKGIQSEYLTLHVSAGTFLPIKDENASAHIMHQEQIIIHKHNIISLLQPNRRVIAVGTTALRTLESMYWYGTLLMHDKDAPFSIHQNTPYHFDGTSPAKNEALEKLLEVMGSRGIEKLTGHTSIYILPGYRFRVVQGLITNFHQPASTLILLIAAFIGPSWKQVYNSALDNHYRFLSYGDSSLLFSANDLST